MGAQTTDFLVLGGGVMGVCLALEAKLRYPDCTVTLLEKEKSCGLHASSRNSGVLHAGFYYTSDSLKSLLTKNGNLRLTEYCINSGLKINRCGKLVVAKNSSDLAGLEELRKRAARNGITLKEVSEAEAKEIEPRAKTFQKALFSPETSAVDPSEVMASLITDAKHAGVKFVLNTPYARTAGNNIIKTRNGINLSAGYIINSAGLYADKIARDFGFSQNYTILPFKGLYLYSKEPLGSFRTHIYPVPDFDYPFLGVHFTVTVTGQAKVGPTAIPAFWREHYGGLENFKLAEFLEILGRELRLFANNDFGFRRLAATELKKHYRPILLKEASRLATGIENRNYRKWGEPGIRAQLFNIKQNNLETDFIFEGDRKSFHVLNAVSPAFTCSMAFSEFLHDKIASLVN